MTTWTRYPAETPFIADRALNAGTSRALLQDNLTTCIEQSGYDYQGILDNGTGDVGISMDATTSWAFAAEWIPECIPIYQAEGGGWREITLALFAVSATDSKVRLFLLDSPIAPSIDTSSGEVTGVTSYVELEFKTGSYEWQHAEATPERYDWIEPAEITPSIGMPVVWLHCAHQLATGTGTVTARSLIITEAY